MWWLDAYAANECALSVFYQALEWAPVIPGFLIEQNWPKNQSNSVEPLVFDWVRQSNKIEHLFCCEFTFEPIELIVPVH